MINVDLLREKVISAAVLGKLSADYVPNATAKDDLEKLGITIDALSSEETPAIKPGWEWVRVSNLGADKYAFADGPFGSNLKREHYTDEKQVRIIQLSNVGELGWKDENEKYTTYEHLETIRRSEVFCGNIVIAKMMPAGRAIIVPNVSDAYVLSSDCVKFVPNSGLNTKYLCYAINSKIFRTQVLHDVHGIGRERTSLSKLKSYLLPIPPIDEQNIIVDRIDYAFDLINQIDALQQLYESDREILKGKIIDAGISGKLTKQLPEDGNADELYDQIQREKARLIKEGKIKKEKPLPEISDDEIPFEIPKNWKWVRLGSVLNEVIVPQRDKPKRFDGDIPWCRIEDADGDYMSESHSNQNVSREIIEEMNLRVFPAGTILSACSGGSIGRILITTTELCTNQTFNGLVCSMGLYNRYLFHFLKNSIGRLKKLGSGAAMEYVSQKKIGEMLIPFPPLEEQKRIVNRIDELISFLSK